MRRLLILLAVPALLLAGIWLGGHPDTLPGPLRDGLIGDEDAQLVREAIDEVADTYYREIPDEELADRSIAGLVDSLDDPFSAYFSPEQFQQFQQIQSSEFSGVGLTVSQVDQGLRIVEVFDGSPAKQGGLKTGDFITAVGGRSLAGMRSDRATALIKGEPGTTVTLSVESGDEDPRDIELTRATITVPAVDSRMVDRDGRKVGVVRLGAFSSGSHAEVYAALAELRGQGADGFVFDLRGNGGGLVSEAQLIASAFLPDGPIVTTRGRSVAEQTLSATGSPVIPVDVPLVVLVDRDSASASEIVAGALQDRGRAQLVGRRTFGKGVFQQVIELSNGGALDITAGQYFTPKGRNLGGDGTAQGDGLAVDVQVADDPETEDRDEAVTKAVDVVTASPSLRDRVATPSPLGERRGG